MYKVFINEHLLRLQSEAPEFDLENSEFAVYEAAENEIQLIVESLFNEKESIRMFLIYKNLNAGWTKFQKVFKIIEAAGGVVSNKNDERLFIHRLGKWDLPKGKMEAGESPEEAAIREVEEECGLRDLEIISNLPNTYHMYKLGSDTILKRTYWFKMRANGKIDIQPQTEEGITEVAWISENELDRVRENTYKSLIELV